ncbi:MAG: hypothetical protein ABF899_01510 [Oenococcus sp.]|uniref:hypothetical protein n=1 Tax=Oenococcus sp. TaxID=1979414 RepID=UPI0039E753F7
MLREGFTKEMARNHTWAATQEESEASMKRFAESYKRSVKFAKQSRERAGKQRKPVIATYLETGEQVELPSIKQASKRLHCSAAYAIKKGNTVQGYRLEYK